MIYNCLFESAWFTLRDKVAPAKQNFGSLQVVIRIMNDKLQEAEEDKQKLNKQVLWLSYLCMTNDCLFESVWFTFRERVAPAPNQNLDEIKAFRLSASCHSCNEWQAAGSRRK